MYLYSFRVAIDYCDHDCDNRKTTCCYIYTFWGWLPLYEHETTDLVVNILPKKYFTKERLIHSSLTS